MVLINLILSLSTPSSCNLHDCVAPGRVIAHDMSALACQHMHGNVGNVEALGLPRVPRGMIFMHLLPIAEPA